MLPVKPASQGYLAERVRSQSDRLPLGSYSVPTSPKIHELRARYEDLHAAGNSNANSDFKITHY